MNRRDFFSWLPSVAALPAAAALGKAAEPKRKPKPKAEASDWAAMQRVFDRNARAKPADVLGSRCWICGVQYDVHGADGICDFCRARREARLRAHERLFADDVERLHYRWQALYDLAVVDMIESPFGSPLPTRKPPSERKVLDKPLGTG